MECIDYAWLEDTLSDDDIEIPHDSHEGDDDDFAVDDVTSTAEQNHDDVWNDLGSDKFAEVQQHQQHQ